MSKIISYTKPLNQVIKNLTKTSASDNYLITKNSIDKSLIEKVSKEKNIVKDSSLANNPQQKNKVTNFDTKNRSDKLLNINNISNTEKILQLSADSLASFKTVSVDNTINELFKSFNVKTFNELAYLAIVIPDKEFDRVLLNRISKESDDNMKRNKAQRQKLKNGIFNNAAVINIKFLIQEPSAAIYNTEKLYNLLNIVFPVALEILKKKYALISSIDMDSITAVFGVPQNYYQYSSQFQAVTAAIQLLKVFKKFQSEVKLITGYDVFISIGISSGQIKTGFIYQNAESAFFIIGQPIIEAKNIADNCSFESICMAENSIEEIVNFYDISDEPINFEFTNLGNKISLKYYKVLF